jgi:hypothetical protein
MAATIAGIVGALTAFPLAALAQPRPLHVAGNHLADSAGNTIRLQGVNVPSMEYTSGGDHVAQAIGVAIDDWRANVIRLPLSQDRWFGKADVADPSQFDAPVRVPSSSADAGEPYRELVDGFVREISSRNCYVLVDLHWSDGGKWGQDKGEHAMPDDKSLLFWKDVSARYKNNPAVLFDLYNEPHDISWDVWRGGGNVDEHNDDPSRGAHLRYHTPGMQAILDAIRASGARNVVVAGGVDWGYDLSGLMSGYALSDRSGSGVMYSSHIYPWKTDIEDRVTPPASRFAVIVGEVGCRPTTTADPSWLQVDPWTWSPSIIAYINAHRLSWTAWGMNPSAPTCLISDWNFRPTTYWGAYVKAALTGRKTDTNDMPEAGSDAPARVLVWDGETADTGSTWVNPTSSTFGPERGDAHSGNRALAFKFDAADIWIGAGFDWLNWKTGNVGTDTTRMKNLTFWIKSEGTTGDLQVQLLCNGKVLDTPDHHTAKAHVLKYCPRLLDGGWHQAVIPLADLTQPAGYDPRIVTMIDFGFSADGEAKGSFIIDDIAFDNVADERGS